MTASDVERIKQHAPQFSLRFLLTVTSVTCICLCVWKLSISLADRMPRRGELTFFYVYWTALVDVQILLVVWSLIRSTPANSSGVWSSTKGRFTRLLTAAAGAVPLALWFSLTAMLLLSKLWNVSPAVTSEFWEFVGNVSLVLCGPSCFAVLLTFLVHPKSLSDRMSVAARLTCIVTAATPLAYYEPLIGGML